MPAWAELATPVGRLVLEGGPDALIAIHLPGGAPRRLDPHRRDPQRLAEALGQLEEYFAGRRRTFDLPLAPAAGGLDRDVRRALLAIPHGRTLSYGELADTVGRPDRIRAVAAANGRNRLPIVVPCHRVIGADGSLVGYRGGLTMKRALLDLEAGCLQQALW
jgi:methylated-DNA-[protein]-cysteine S-methyltransferase